MSHGLGFFKPSFADSRAVFFFFLEGISRLNRFSSIAGVLGTSL